jgi:hypothetical protein
MTNSIEARQYGHSTPVHASSDVLENRRLCSTLTVSMSAVMSTAQTVASQTPALVDGTPVISPDWFVGGVNLPV